MSSEKVAQQSGPMYLLIMPDAVEQIRCGMGVLPR